MRIFLIALKYGQGSSEISLLEEVTVLRKLVLFLLYELSIELNLPVSERSTMVEASTFS
jgi:hypothetical protein